jgi:hypothetical protein
MVVAPDLDALGLPSNVPLLLCAGTPFKYSPAHDKVWIEISRRAAPCRLVFFRARDAEVSPLLEQRLERRYRRRGSSSRIASRSSPRSIARASSG